MPAFMTPITKTSGSPTKLRLKSEMLKEAAVRKWRAAVRRCSKVMVAAEWRVTPTSSEIPARQISSHTTPLRRYLWHVVCGVVVSCGT